jgi:ribose transport system permease protein
MSISTITPQAGSANILRSIWAWIKKVPPVYPVFLIIFVVLGILNHSKYQTMSGIMIWLRTVAPLAILAIGEMFVLALGGFDLSVGAIVTFVVLVSSKLLANDPANATSSILIMLGFGAAIGLVNGLVVNYLKVPSFIATLGMMLVVRGGALYYVGGAPQGYLTDNWRAFGRNYIEKVPLLGRVPYALIILIVITIIAYFLFHRTHYGRQILAIGDNVRASQLSGVQVKLVRMITFIICSVFAVIAGVMIGGYGGVNMTIGQGMEMTTIAGCVVGGVLMGGGKGNVFNAIFGAFTLQAIVNLLNLMGLPKPYTDAVQGLLIIGAVAYAGLTSMRKR